MNEERITESPPWSDPRGQVMKTPDDVAEMLRLKACGWGLKRIARHLGCSHHTVKAYVAAGGVKPFKSPERPKLLDGLEGWLRERFIRHRGNADVVRQDLLAEKGMAVSRRTLQRAVQAYRQALKAEALATTRFETPPGRQLQIDFGERLVEIGGAKIKAFVFVATLGHSRRLHVRAFRAEKQEHWFGGLESAFTTFGGVPEEVLMDNPRALVVRHDAVGRSVQFNDKLLAFAKHWGFRPVACAPYRARTKGKTESGVGYVKKNAIAGHCFASWEAFEAHLARWEREVANVRIHGTTGEAPIARFENAEAHRLKPLGGRPSFGSLRELTRVVGNDCAVEIDTNSYSVPWRLIGERVAVTVAAGEVRIRHGVREVAVHKQSEGRRLRIVDSAHLDGVAGRDGAVCRAEIATSTVPASSPPPSLLRPLAEYEAAIGGRQQMARAVARGCADLGRVAGILDPGFKSFAAVWDAIQRMGADLGLDVSTIALRQDGDAIEPEVAALAERTRAGLIVLPTAMNNLRRDRIIALAARYRLPAVYPFRHFAVDGGLMAYGFDPPDLFQRSAAYVARILKGERPADLPVQAPVKYEFVFNLKTAKALGLDAPASLLARADEVIE